MDTMTQAFEEATQQIAALGNSLIIIVVALSIVPYILFAIGLGSVAKTCRIRHSWMAWLPIARKHLLTEIADLRRVQVGKPKRLTVQFEIITVLCLICVLAMVKVRNPVLVVIPAILLVLLSFNQAFAYYYFYRLCDKENSTIYFLLGQMAKPLNSFFVFHCR
ncbi:MAG: hypothetical protein ACLSH2_04525 [Oscillospiraceae bacterium]